MNPLRVNFAELYQRHMCRHSQYGINVIHLVSLVGIYAGLCGCALRLMGTPWPLIAFAAAYLVVLLFNVPLRLLLLTGAFLTLFFALLLALPPMPFWVYLLLLYPSYKVQAWSHHVYSKASDMTELNRKYPKGPALFVLLTTYELPMQLIALVFDSQAKQATVSQAVSESQAIA